MTTRHRFRSFEVPRVLEDWDVQLVNAIDEFLTADEPLKVVSITFRTAGDFELAFLVYEEEL